MNPLILLSLVLTGAGLRSFEFSYEARIVPPRGAKKVEVWIPCPKDTPHQDIVGLTVEGVPSWEVFYDREYGNAILHIASVNPQPFAVGIRFGATRREWNALKDGKNFSGPSAIDPSLMRRYLGANKLVTLGPRVKKIAAEVTKGKTTELERARAIYSYVLSTMTYDKSGTGWGRGDTEYACDVRKGNCTDFHSLFISLVRASGVPAKFVIGALIPTGTEGSIPGYHCWAEFYLPERGWIPVDISEAWHHRKKADYFFGSLDENRIAFSEGRDVLLEPPQKGERLNYFFFPYVEADGRPLEGARTRLFFSSAGE